MFDSFKVAKLLLMMNWEAAVWFSVWFVEILNFLMCLLILISYFIWFSALLCYFELLDEWWRNRWVDLYWYEIFLCGFEVFECFEELFFVDALFDVSNVRCFSDFGRLMFDVSSYNKRLPNLLNSSELVDIVRC